MKAKMTTIFLTILLYSCNQQKQSGQIETTGFKEYKASKYISEKLDSNYSTFSMKITKEFDVNNLPKELLLAADTITETQFLSFSDQKDEFKYNLAAAPGTLVKIVKTDETAGTRTFQSVVSVLKAGVKIEAKAPSNTEVDEQVIDKKRKFELKFVIGSVELRDEERYQFLKQDILYSAVLDTAINKDKVAQTLKLDGMDSDVNKYWIITEAILQSYTYKKFTFLGKTGKIKLPITTSTVDSDGGTYKQTTDFKNTLVVRLVVRPAIAYRPVPSM